MIVGSRSWIGLIFRLRGSVLRAVGPRVVINTLLATAITYAVMHYRPSFTTSMVPFSVVGFALSIFLGFRNNTSYDRFWEGRKLWGRLINTTRSLARQVLTLVDYKNEQSSDALTSEQRGMVECVVAYAHCLRLHLRDERDHSDLRPFMPADEIASLDHESNRPVAILQNLASRFAKAAREGRVDSYHLGLLENTLTDLTDIQGGCERIKSTPIPFTYTVLMHRIVGMYCLFLPLGLIKHIGTATPFVVAFVSYAFFGLDAIGDEIEEPFGTDVNDLPLSTISRMIEVNLRQRLGDESIPDLLKPVKGLLQ
jgi:ion channel-forming bestrophin family protein